MEFNKKIGGIMQIFQMLSGWNPHNSPSGSSSKTTITDKGKGNSSQEGGRQSHEKMENGETIQEVYQSK